MPDDHPVEHRFPDREFPVDRSLVRTFAHAIGEQNPVVFDREAARAAGLPDLAAPLTFVQASAHADPDYPLRPRVDAPWFGSAGGPGTPHPALANTLHGEQHFEYHRPLVVGDVLTWEVVDGEQWTKTGRSGGVLAFSERITRYRDAAGQPVVTARAVVVRTEKRQGEA